MIYIDEILIVVQRVVIVGLSHQLTTHCELSMGLGKPSARAVEQRKSSGKGARRMLRLDMLMFVCVELAALSSGTKTSCRLRQVSSN